MAALRNGGSHVITMIRGALARGTGAGSELTIPAGDAVFLWDAKRHGNEGPLMKAFITPEGKTITKDKTTVFVAYDEETLAARMGAVRGVATLEQTEFLHIITKESCRAPTEKGKFRGGDPRTFHWSGAAGSHQAALADDAHEQKGALWGSTNR